jgi:hypothetical protein
LQRQRVGRVQFRGAIAREGIDVVDGQPAQAGAPPALGALIGDRQALERVETAPTHSQQPFRLLPPPSELFDRLASQDEAGCRQYFAGHVISR